MFSRNFAAACVLYFHAKRNLEKWKVKCLKYHLLRNKIVAFSRKNTFHSSKIVSHFRCTNSCLRRTKFQIRCYIRKNTTNVTILRKIVQGGPKIIPFDWHRIFRHDQSRSYCWPLGMPFKVRLFCWALQCENLRIILQFKNFMWIPGPLKRQSFRGSNSVFT